MRLSRPSLVLFVGLWFICVGISFFRLTEAARDFYKILGVDKKAETAHIKTAYRKLARVYHPDSNDAEDAKDKFIDIADAYEVLTDANKRKLFDEYGEDGLDPNFIPGGSRGGQHFVYRSEDGQQFFFQFNGAGGGHPFAGGSGGFPFGGFGGGGGRRAPPPASFYTDTEVIQIVSMSSWKREIEDENIQWATLVNFYSPKCGHCADMKDAYVKIAKKFENIISVAAVDCLRASELCQSFSLRQYPTIRLYPTRGDTHFVELEGDDTSEKALGAWLSKSLPSFATILTPSNFEPWLSEKPQAAKVVLFTNKPAVPPIFKLLSCQFERQLSMSVVFESQTKVASRFKPPKFPAILHLVDIDALTGEWMDVTSNVELLSLKMSRIITQKRSKLGPYSVESTYRELTKRQMDAGDCGKSDAKTCFILVLYGKDGDVAQSAGAAVDEVSRSYRQDPMSFYFVDARHQSAFVKAFGLSAPKCQEDVDGKGKSCTPILIAYRPKRQKFKLLQNATFDAHSIKSFVDSIIASGGANMDGRIVHSQKLFLAPPPESHGGEL